MSIYNLDHIEMQAYSSIYKAVQNHACKAALPPISIERAHGIYRKVLSEAPEGYLYNPNEIRAMSSLTGQILTFERCVSDRERTAVDMQMAFTMLDIEKIASRQPTVRDTIEAVYAFFVDNYLYEYDNRGDKRYHRAIAPFVYKKAVCEGFAMALAMVLNHLGIPAGVITGESRLNGSNGSHAWNIVAIGNRIYHLDVTWDICTKTDRKSSYDYFLLDDRTIRRDHSWNDSTIPAATDQNLEYYAYRGLRCTTRAACVQLLVDGLNNHQKEIAFRYTGYNVEQIIEPNALQMIFNEAHRKRPVMFKAYQYTYSVESGTAKFFVEYSSEL